MCSEQHVEEPPVWADRKKALLLMDVFYQYHGQYLAEQARNVYGVATISVFSDYMRGYFLIEEPEEKEQYLAMCMPDEANVKEWRQSLDGLELVAVSCDSDSGLADAERLGAMLNVTFHNGSNEARRNKYLMIETVGKAGLPVVKQRLCQTMDETCNFAKELGITESRNVHVVVKPIRGVAL